MLSNYKPPFNAEQAIKDRMIYLFFDQRFSSDAKELTPLSKIREH
jgi:hypothetical protein